MIFFILNFREWGFFSRIINQPRPKRDGITIRVVDNDSVRAQAIASEIIDGAQLGYTFSAVLNNKGYRALADLSAGFYLLVGSSILTFSPHHSPYSQILDMTGTAAPEFEWGGRSPDNYRLCK